MGGLVGGSFGPGFGVGVLSVVFEFLLEPGDLGFQVGEEFLHFGFAGIGCGIEQVALFVGVVDEVEEFVGVAVPVVDELVGFGADAEMGHGVVVAGAVVVAVVEGLPPVVG